MPKQKTQGAVEFQPSERFWWKAHDTGGKLTQGTRLGISELGRSLRQAAGVRLETLILDNLSVSGPKSSESWVKLCVISGGTRGTRPNQPTEQSSKNKPANPRSVRPGQSFALVPLDNSTVHLTRIPRTCRLTGNSTSSPGSFWMEPFNEPIFKPFIDRAFGSPCRHRKVSLL